MHHRTRVIAHTAHGLTSVDAVPPGKVTFRRQVLGKRDVPNWAKSTCPIRPIKVDPRGKIEDADTPFHADFANKYIGGGVLSRVSHRTRAPHSHDRTHGTRTARTAHALTTMGQGCVQEEILFVLKPECLVSMYARHMELLC
jgi:hypothetical protein